jgi:hypothetical protein
VTDSEFTVSAAVIPMLLAVTGASVAAIAAYFLGLNKKEETAVEIKMGNIKITLNGNLSSKQANDIVRIIATSNILENVDENNKSIEEPIGLPPPTPTEKDDGKNPK